MRRVRLLYRYQRYLIFNFKAEYDRVFGQSDGGLVIKSLMATITEYIKLAGYGLVGI